VRPAAGDDGPRLIARGFAVQAANPKALVFFTALLPQFIDPASSVAFQVGVLGVTSVAIEFVVLVGYGVLAGRAARLAETPLIAACWSARRAPS
jgi:homoserine/homoserine lactone efflux protein